MRQKERIRQVILTGVVEKKLMLIEASKKLGVSYRQAKRIYKQYCAVGAAGLWQKKRKKKGVSESMSTSILLSRTTANGWITA
jgi:hypothetical protein